MITPGTISTPLKEFILENQKAPIADSSAAIDAFCKKIEDVIIVAITKATITIPPSTVQVLGSSGASVNPTAIILNNVIS